VEESETIVRPVPDVQAQSYKRPVTTTRIKEKDAQTAAILSLDAQSRFDVRFIGAPISEGGKSPFEWRGTLSNLHGPEKHPERARGRLARAM